MPLLLSSLVPATTRQSRIRRSSSGSCGMSAGSRPRARPAVGRDRVATPKVRCSGARVFGQQDGAELHETAGWCVEER